MAEFFNPDKADNTPAVSTPVTQPTSNIRENVFYKAIVEDIVVPRAMDTLYDVGVSLLNKLCYKNFSKKGYYTHTDGYVSYDRAYGRRTPNRESGTVVVVGTGKKADPYRGKANTTIYPCIDYMHADLVMDQMTERLVNSGKLTVQDMYDILQMSGAPVTACDFGWTDISKATRGKDPMDPSRWVIFMPNPVNVKNI